MSQRCLCSVQELSCSVAGGWCGWVYSLSARILAIWFLGILNEWPWPLLCQLGKVFIGVNENFRESFVT